MKASFVSEAVRVATELWFVKSLQDEPEHFLEQFASNYVKLLVNARITWAKLVQVCG
jgi:hypothetical protein